MFGSGLPVLACTYNCISGNIILFAFNFSSRVTRCDFASELISDGLDGHLFDSEERLGQLLVDMFCSSSSSMLAVTKQHVLRLQQKRWNDNWNSIVLPVLRRV